MFGESCYAFDQTPAICNSRSAFDKIPSIIVSEICQTSQLTECTRALDERGLNGPCLLPAPALPHSPPPHSVPSAPSQLPLTPLFGFRCNLSIDLCLLFARIKRRLTLLGGLGIFLWITYCHDWVLSFNVFLNR